MSIQFRTLWRAFCAQLVGDAMESEAAYRHRLVMIFACLIAPAFFILIFLYPDFSGAVIRARYHRAPASIIDDRLEWISFILISHAMVGVGFVTVLAWESLTFSVRDAMVLGPLPVRPTILFAAKTAALGTLLVAAAVPLALVQATLFAIETTIVPSLWAFLFRLGVTLVTLLAASLFTFAAVLALRALAVLCIGARRASALGPMLQFLFVLAMMMLVFMSPAVVRSQYVTVRSTDALPSAWFVGMFERLRGSPRADWPQFALLARRAMAAVPIALIAAIGFSAFTFRQQMRAALSPVVHTATISTAGLFQAIARRLAGRSQFARETADFVVLTLSRCRPQQQPIAVALAMGSAIALTELMQRIHVFADALEPRAVTFCVPLVLGYCIVLGLRRALKMPAELPAAWTFRFNAPEARTAVSAGVRASVYGVAVVPLAVLTALFFSLAIGWRLGAWHTLVVTCMTAFLTELMLLGVDDMPFTRAEQPPETGAPVWWVFYLLGLMFFVYLPGRLESNLIAHGRSPLLIAGVAAVAAVAVAVLRTAALRRRRIETDVEYELVPLGGIQPLGLN